MANETKWRFKIPLFNFKRSKPDKENLHPVADIQDPKLQSRDNRRVQFGGNTADEEYDYDQAISNLPNPYKVVTQPKRHKAPQSLPGGDMQMSRGIWSRASRRSSRHAAAVTDAMNRSFQSEFLAGPSTSTYSAEIDRRRSRGSTAPSRHRVASVHRVDNFIDESSTQSSAYYAEHDGAAHGRALHSRRKALHEEKEEIHWLRQQNYNVQAKLDHVLDKLQRKSEACAKMRDKYQELQEKYQRLLKSDKMKEHLISRLEGELSRLTCGYGIAPAALMPQNHGIIHTPQTHTKPSRGGSSTKSGRQQYENHSSYVDSSITGVNDSNSVITGASSIGFSERPDMAAFQSGRKFRSFEARAGSGESLAERSDTSMNTGGTNTKTASNSTDVGNSNAFARPHLPAERRPQHHKNDEFRATRALHKASDSLPPNWNNFNDPLQHLPMSTMYPPMPVSVNNFLSTPAGPHNPFAGAAPSSLPTKNHKTNEMFMSLNIGNDNPNLQAMRLSEIPTMQRNAMLLHSNRDYLFHGNTSTMNNYHPSNQIDDNDVNDEVKNFRTQNDSSIHDTDATEELERDKMQLANDSVNTSSGTNSDVFSSPEHEETARGSSPNDSSYYGGMHRGTDSSATITATLTEDSSSSPYESLVHLPLGEHIKYVEENCIAASTSHSYRKAGQPTAKERTLHHSRSSPSMMYANIPVEINRKNRDAAKSISANIDSEDKENRQPII